MAAFSAETIDRVREAADIVEIVSAHSDLRRQGERFTGLCPFHEERTPSFSVDPNRKLYYCFGCEAKGDVFSFVEQKDGLSFPEAVEVLADRYGVELVREKEDPKAEEARRRRTRLGELMERTASFYASFLWESPKAEAARKYLAGRGLKEEVLREFGVGFAPSAWDSVVVRGQQAGYGVEELRASGLVQRGRQGGFYDRFRSRIIFPVRDQRGRVLGFGARELRSGQGPKYLNSPEGELYRKSATLFGIDRARGEISKLSHAIVVEGYTDVLALHQAGMRNAVAVMGTAITPEQVTMLSTAAETVTLAMDADRAGQDAMLRAQRVAGSRRMRLRVAALPADTDPCDLVAKGEPERFTELVERAVDLPEFQVTSALDRADLRSPAGRDQALAEVGPLLAGMDESVGRNELVRTLAERLDTDAGLIAARIAAAAGTSPSGQEAIGPRSALTPQERRERALLAMSIADPAQGAPFLARITEEHLSSPVAARAVAWLREHLDDPLSGLPRDDAELVSLVTELMVLSEREPATAGAMELAMLQLDQRLVEGRIAAASEKGEYERQSELSRERAELVEKIAHHEGIDASKGG